MVRLIPGVLREGRGGADVLVTGEWSDAVERGADCR